MEDINKYFAHASKVEGSDRPGYPDFIVTNKTYPGIIMLAECKANPNDLKIAATEVRHYAQFLMGKYDIIMVAVVGTTTDNFRTVSAIYRKDRSMVKNGDPEDFDASKLYTLEEYEKFIGYTKRVEDELLRDLQKIKNDTNNTLYESGGLDASDRMLITSAALLALRDNVFKNSYVNYAITDLLDGLLQAVERTLKNYRIPSSKVNTMMQSFNILRQKQVLINGSIDKYGNIINPIKSILDLIHRSNVHDALENATLNIDIMGSFYNEFITHKLGRSDAENGFVLTPRHICELFADLGELDENTKVVDMCFGTGGFLVAALQKEIIAAKRDKSKITNIRNNNICGVEIDGDKFSYGCVNMILRGDGQSNMEKGDCFNEDIRNLIKSKHCTVGFINPPYAKPNHELKFVNNMLDCLEPGGRGIAIIPSSCGTKKSGDDYYWQTEILKNHTLDAVMTMPIDLFHGSANAATCIMVFTAHKPHDKSRKTWFADWTYDGFEKDRTVNGRSDKNNKWKDIKKKWLEAFFNKDEIEGFSLRRAVGPEDEWSYAKYAKTNFSGITDESFKKVIKEYALFILGQTKI